MQAAAPISVSEYLSTSYRPDCDYVDEVIVERNVGERIRAPGALTASPGKACGKPVRACYAPANWRLWFRSQGFQLAAFRRRHAGDMVGNHQAEVANLGQ